MPSHQLPEIPDSLRENLAFTLGDADATTWLATAVGLAEELLTHWQLRPLEVLSGGSMSLCIKCEDDEGELFVLKIPANVQCGADEAAALRAWHGNGAARVINEEPGSRAILMNYLGAVGEGGYGLADVVDLADRLHAGNPGNYLFAHVDDNLMRRITWAADRFRDPEYQCHLRDVELAEKLVAELVYAGDRHVLLHGDLQAKNLILSGTELTAVDPLPVMGPALFDLAFWIAKSVHAEPTLTYVERVAALRPDVDAEGLLRWTWALAVLEHRPYVERGYQQRLEFIDGLRPEVTV